MAENPVKLCALTSPNFGHFVRSRQPTLGTPDFGETPDSGETVCGHLPLATADHLGTERERGLHQRAKEGKEGPPNKPKSEEVPVKKRSAGTL